MPRPLLTDSKFLLKLEDRIKRLELTYDRTAQHAQFAKFKGEHAKAMLLNAKVAIYEFIIQKLRLLGSIVKKAMKQLELLGAKELNIKKARKLIKQQIKNLKKEARTVTDPGKREFLKNRIEELKRRDAVFKAADQKLKQHKDQLKSNVRKMVDYIQDAIASKKHLLSGIDHKLDYLTAAF